MNQKYDGIRAVAEMMNLLDENTRQRIMGELETREPAVAARIKDSMFTFVDLLQIPVTELQKALKLLPSRKVALAMRGLPPDAAQLVFQALSKRGGEALQEEIQGLGPQKLSAVEEARRDVTLMVLKLASEGKLSLR